MVRDSLDPEGLLFDDLDTNDGAGEGVNRGPYTADVGGIKGTDALLPPGVTVFCGIWVWEASSLLPPVRAPCVVGDGDLTVEGLIGSGSVVNCDGVKYSPLPGTLSERLLDDLEDERLLLLRMSDNSFLGRDVPSPLVPLSAESERVPAASTDSQPVGSSMGSQVSASRIMTASIW